MTSSNPPAPGHPGPPGAPGPDSQDQAPVSTATGGNSLALRIELLSKAQKARRQQPSAPAAAGAAGAPANPGAQAPSRPARPATPQGPRRWDAGGNRPSAAGPGSANDDDGHDAPRAQTHGASHPGPAEDQAPGASDQLPSSQSSAAAQASQHTTPWDDPRTPAGSRYTFEQWQAAYEGTPMVGDQARLCVFEIHAAQDSVLVRFPLNARDGSPTIDAATAFYLNRCLLLGPGAPRLYPQAEDAHPFPLVSPTLGPWNYRLVRPTDPEYEAECGLLRKAKFLGEGYVLGQPDKPVDAPVAADTPHASVADQAAADGSLDLGDEPAPAPTIQRERGG